MKNFTITAILLMLTATTAGCGYTTSSSLPSSMRTIYIPAFKNNINFTTASDRNIYFPLLETDVRNAIIKRIQFDGNMRIAGEEAASMILQGELVDYRRQPLRYTDNDDVQEYRVQVIMNLVLWDTAADEPLWKEDGFAGEADYFITGPTVSTESAAVQDAITDLARRVVERIVENW